MYYLKKEERQVTENTAFRERRKGNKDKKNVTKYLTESRGMHECSLYYSLNISQ